MSADQLAAEAAKQISEWEAKEYGKPAYAFASQQKEQEVISAIIKSVIEKAYQAGVDHVAGCNKDNSPRAAHTSEQSADTKRLDWLLDMISASSTNTAHEIFGAVHNRFTRSHIDAAMSQMPEWTQESVKLMLEETGGSQTKEKG